MLTENLKKLSEDNGAALFSVAHAGDFSGYTGKSSPYYYLKNANSVIVVGYHLTDPLLDTWKYDPENNCDICVVNEKLGSISLELIGLLLEYGENAFLSPYSGIYTKDAAVLANMGIIGKNNLLITEKYGPRVRLRTIITDAQLIKCNVKPRSPCDECQCYCWSACPAGAFTDGKYNKDTCSRYSDEHVKKLGENEFLFCRECELACPVGRLA